ncbi:MAG TPA: ribosome maturation factor RimM [Gemmatimonadaceae bacterium]|nr:ribosome maturation factor RimM [Gemmatimonadaceae bacterium]
MTGDASSASGRARPAWVIVGRIRRAHGIRGEVVVESLTASPEIVFAAGKRLFAGSAKRDTTTAPVPVHVDGAEPFQQGYRLRLSEIPDRTVAEQWNGRYLLLPAEELPEPEAGAVYLRDLVGLRVERPGGEAIGEVIAWYELPQGLMIEVSRGRDTVLLPYRDPFVQSVDISQRRLVIEPPEGLLE